MPSATGKSSLTARKDRGLNPCRLPDVRPKGDFDCREYVGSVWGRHFEFRARQRAGLLLRTTEMQSRSSQSEAVQPSSAVPNVLKLCYKPNMALSWEDRIYRRTAAGEEVIASANAAIPSEYRRILGVIEGDTHSDIIRGLLRQFPDSLMADWLSELEEIGFVTSVPADPAQDLDFTNLMQTRRDSMERTPPEDTQRIAKQASAAARMLDRAGAFLSPDRLKNRSSLAKKPNEILVLVVEDDPDQAALAELRVSMAGFKVRLARNCKEFVEEIQARVPPDVLLLDIMLPDGNGFDVLTGIRRHPKLALLPVVMLTVLAAPEDVRGGLALGADGYITKPYSKKIMADTIRAVLKHT